MAATRYDPLRTLAHPLRARLYRTLRLEGAATATMLARRLDTNTGATSYHLRQLAGAGLVVDAEDTVGSGRRRHWQAVPSVAPVRHAEVRGDAEAEASLVWLERDVVAHISEQAERWLSEATSAPPQWRDASSTSAELVLVTASALEAMRAEMHAVVRRYRRQGQGSPQARRVAVYTVSIPLDLPVAAASTFE